MSESEVKDAVDTSENGEAKAGVVAVKPREDPEKKVEQAKELNVSETINSSDDKLDEFSRLELEMAELDKTDDGLILKKSQCNVNVVNQGSEKVPTFLNKDNKTQGNESIQQDKMDEDMPIVHQNGQSTETAKEASTVDSSTDGGGLDHEDLIAVLKGETVQKALLVNKNTVDNHGPPKEIASATSDTDLLIEGVTIEGEGEYQIMEVVDDIDEEAESDGPSTSKVLSIGSKLTNKASTNQKLTPEEERAMAMEQIAGLNARVPRRRKQDMKRLQVETSELVSTLGDDWSDDEEDMNANGEHPTSTKNTVSVKSVKSPKKDNTLKSQSAVAEVSSTAGDTKSAVTVPVNKRRRTSVSAKVTSVVLVKPPVGEVVNDAGSNVADSSVTPTPEATISTGFKRTRVIKRRIIWDPDAPETAISYAKFVRNTAKDSMDLPAPVGQPKPQSSTTKEAMATEKRKTKRAATPLQPGASKVTVSESGLKFDSSDFLPSNRKQARRSLTVSPDVSNSGIVLSGGKKKKISEIDRLMGDEGAINMLNSLESGRKKHPEESDGKPHKPLMRNRGNPSEKQAPKKEGADSSTVTSASPPKNKRVAKPKASADWDYVFEKKQQLSDDSMIIRRRSNSSYSSNASQHRLSLDGPSGLTPKSIASSADVPTDASAESEMTPVPKKSTGKITLKRVNNATEEESSSISPDKSNNGADSKAFEFAKPKDAKSNRKPQSRRNKANANAGATNTLANDIQKPPKRGPRRPASTERLGTAEPTTAQNLPINNTAISSGVGAEEVSVRKVGKAAHILLNLSGSQISCTYTPQLMSKVVKALNGLAEDVNCHVVVVTTNSPHFCQGIDFGTLATGSPEQRKSAATTLATATKNFLRKLATFPKPLVAGIHGTIIGLGVTQLPLFDIVIASDKSCFETPYAKIGQTPEGFCIWQRLSNVRKTAKTKLLWLAEKMYSNEAATTGLVDKLTTSEKVTDDALNIAKKLASLSAETYSCMKQLTIEKRTPEIMSSLDAEFEEITKQWISTECFNKFKKCMEVGHF